MGNFFFIVLHVCSLLFGLVGLVVTIPLHLIYLAIRDKPKPATVKYPGPGDLKEGMVRQVNCPECKELIRSDARKCKHCGSSVTPET